MNKREILGKCSGQIVKRNENDLKDIRIVFVSMIASIFLLSAAQSSFSQVENESLQEISDEDLELLDEYLEQAEELFVEESYEEAILYYDKVLAIDLTDIDALYGKALSLYNISNYEEAITYYDKVLAIDSTNSDALVGKANSLDNMGKSEEAISYYEKALELEIDEEAFQDISDEDLELLDEYLEQAEELFEEESYEEAISSYDKALEIKSTNSDALFGKSLALDRLGREDESLSNLEKITIPESPVEDFRTTQEETEKQIGAEEIAKTDQILFAIVVGLIVIVISIITINFIVRKKTASNETKIKY